MKQNKAIIMHLIVKIISGLFPGAFNVFLVYLVYIPDIFILHLHTSIGG